jgi:hypothetical protein
LYRRFPLTVRCCVYHPVVPVPRFCPTRHRRTIFSLKRVYYASPHQCPWSGEGEQEGLPIFLRLPLALVSFFSRFISALYPVHLLFRMESRIIARRPSAPLPGDGSRQIPRGADVDGLQEAHTKSSASSSLLDPRAQLTMERFLQDLPNAEQPPQEFPPQYHTGRMPNSKAGDGKPRLLLMGQRR